jgi:DNA-directed RNA polymerase specialized sigma24 family protein
MKNKIILIAEKNEIWIDIVQSFGCTKETAEDIVQEMYIKIQKTLKNGVAVDIMYNGEEINYYYIFKCLNSIFIDLKRREKNRTMVSIEDYEKLGVKWGLDLEVNFEQAYSKMQIELKKMYWYDRKVFEIINSGESIAELSRQSDIPYYSLYNTYHKVKDKLKKIYNEI